MDPFQFPFSYYWEEISENKPIQVEFDASSVALNLTHPMGAVFPKALEWNSSVPPNFRPREELSPYFFNIGLGLLVHPESRGLSKLLEIGQVQFSNSIYHTDTLRIRFRCLSKIDRDKQRWEHPSGIATWQMDVFKGENTLCLEAQISTVVSKQHPFMEIDRESLAKAFDTLTETSQAKWGYMTPQHLVEHFEYFYQMALGNIPGDILIPEEVIPKYQNSLWNYKPIPYQFQHPMLKKGEAEDLRFSTLEEAKLAFWKSYEAVEAYYSNNPDGKLMISMFGMLDRYHWYLQNRKHFTYHFQQFGIV